MKCYICDREDDLISFDRAYETFNPCHTCQEVIDDCIAGYGTEDEVPELEEAEVFEGP